MSDKYRTPSSKPKGMKLASATKSAASSRYAQDTPRKHFKPNQPHKNVNIVDEEIPQGFLDGTVTRLDAWKTVQPHDDLYINDLAGPSGVSDAASSGPSELSIVAEFDELVKDYWALVEDDVGDEFLEFAINQEKCRKEWLEAVKECRRLQSELDKANHEIGDFSNKLNHARKLLDQEKKLRRRAEEELDHMERQMIQARDLLFNDKYHGRIPDETREKLAFLNNSTVRSRGSLDHNTLGLGGRLNTISEVNSQEINSTGSLLSDLSYSRSEDDLDTSIHTGRKWMKHQPAPHIDEPTAKKRRSSSGKVVEINVSDKIIATTTVQVHKDGPITATSIIESVPQEEPPVKTHRFSSTPQRDVLSEIHPPNTQDMVEKMWSGICINNNNGLSGGRSSLRQHSFVPKTVIRPDTCGPCNKRIRFGKIVLRCKECRGVCHTECKDKLPLPCIPLVNTPTQKGVIGTIGDYAPTIPPMVPALIIHCVNEVELRGLNEVGIYRVPGSEKEVKVLREKFLKGKGTPMLNDVDVHVICGVIKDFLRSIQEPIVTQSLWKDFIKTAEARDVIDVPPLLYQAISQLPAPNRDTLAYLMLHLQRVSESKDCKMPVGNLAKIFGPTIIGYSSQDLDPNTVLTETRHQAVVMEYLLSLPGDYWQSFVNVNQRPTEAQMTRALYQTPSTDSLLRQNTNRGFFTPHSSRTIQSVRKQRKFFGTPPTK